MGGFLSSIMERWGKFYRRSSIQVILSLSFTAVAVAGMIFLGLTLFLRFSASNNAQLAKNSQRVLAQVNLNLDAYLRGMMRVSDTMYYRVIKNADLDSDSLDAQMALLYESNRDSLVSIAVFAQSGELVSATPLATLKKSVAPQRQDWFAAAVDRIENQAGQERIAAYAAFTKERGFTPLPVAHFHDLNVTESRRELDRILAEYPTALIVCGESVALQSAYELRKRGYRIPEDISLVTSELANICSWLTPEMTAMNQDLDALAARTVSLLLSRIRNPDSPRENIWLPTSLIVRGSVKHLTT